MTDSRLPVVVYGATGFTGTLVCEELERQGIPFAVAGRNRSKLEALSRRLPSRPPFLPAPLDDRQALRVVAERGRVLLSCAGPFVRFGGPVQDAALAAGAHWLDTSGEYPFLVSSRARDEEARDRGVALVNAVGFDVVPSDAAAALAAERIGAVETVRVAVASSSGGASRGTIRSILEVAAAGGCAFRDGALAPEPLGAERWEVDFPEPFGRRTCISSPMADVVTAPATTGARNARAFQPGSPAIERVIRWAPWILAVPRLSPVRGALDALVRLFPDPRPGAPGRFAVVAEARSGSRAARAWVAGGAGGYTLTARWAVLCARLAADPRFDRRGALTPSQAFGAKRLLEEVAQVGVRFGVEEIG